MKTRRPTFLAIHIILLIIAAVLTLYFSTKFVQVERETKAQDMGKSYGKMKEKFNVPTLKRNKKTPIKKPPKRAEADKQHKPKKNSPLAEYQEIVDKNLFRPLGWEGKKPNNSFRLVGTVIDSSSQKAKAIITHAGNPEIFFVSEGDIIGNGYKVEEISAKQVKLANAEKGGNFVMQFGWTPLSWAALLGQTETAELLIQKGADINAKNMDVGTSLHGAAFLGQTETVELLIQKGADVNAKNNDGLTPLDTSAVDWKTTEFVAALLGLKVDEEKVKTGRAKIAGILRQHSAKHDTQTGSEKLTLNNPTR